MLRADRRGHGGRPGLALAPHTGEVEVVVRAIRVLLRQLFDHGSIQIERTKRKSKIWSSAEPGPSSLRGTAMVNNEPSQTV